MYNYLESLKLLGYAHGDTSKLQIVHIRRIFECASVSERIDHSFNEFFALLKQGGLGHFISGL